MIVTGRAQLRAQCRFERKKTVRENCWNLLILNGAGGRNRTVMELPPEDFESLYGASRRPLMPLICRTTTANQGLFLCVRSRVKCMGITKRRAQKRAQSTLGNERRIPTPTALHKERFTLLPLLPRNRPSGSIHPLLLFFFHEMTCCLRPLPVADIRTG